MRQKYKFVCVVCIIVGNKDGELEKAQAGGVKIRKAKT